MFSKTDYGVLYCDRDPLQFHKIDILYLICSIPLNYKNIYTYVKN
jgi:hypothetical protein